MHRPLQGLAYVPKRWALQANYTALLIAQAMPRRSYALAYFPAKTYRVTLEAGAPLLFAAYPMAAK
jgi:hypothetical protein